MDRKTRITMIGVAAASLLLMAAPSAFASTGTLNCYSPSTCAGGALHLTGPGTTGVAHYYLASTLASGSVVNYFVCLSTDTSCSSSTGTSNGWTWAFCGNGVTLATCQGAGYKFSGKTGTSAACTTAGGTSCEGNGDGTPSDVFLSVTAPGVITSTNSQVSLEIEACASTGTSTLCDTLGQAVVASASITVTAPQFPLGVATAVVVGMFGLVLLKKKGGIGFQAPQAAASV